MTYYQKLYNILHQEVHSDKPLSGGWTWTNTRTNDGKLENLYPIDVFWGERRLGLAWGARSLIFHIFEDQTCAMFKVSGFEGMFVVVEDQCIYCLNHLQGLVLDMDRVDFAVVVQITWEEFQRGKKREYVSLRIRKSVVVVEDQCVCCLSHLRGLVLDVDRVDFAVVVQITREEFQRGKNGSR